LPGSRERGHGGGRRGHPDRGRGRPGAGRTPGGTAQQRGRGAQPGRRPGPRRTAPHTRHDERGALGGPGHRPDTLPGSRERGHGSGRRAHPDRRRTRPWAGRMPHAAWDGAQRARGGTGTPPGPTTDVATHPDRVTDATASGPHAAWDGAAARTRGGTGTPTGPATDVAAHTDGGRTQPLRGPHAVRGGGWWPGRRVARGPEPGPTQRPSHTRPWADRPGAGPLAVRDGVARGRLGARSVVRPGREVVGVSEGQASVWPAGEQPRPAAGGPLLRGARAPEAGTPPGLRAPAGTPGPVGRPMLSLTLASLMDEVHAHSGAVYLLAPDQPVLEMAV